MKFDPSGDIGYQLTQILAGGVMFGEHIEGGYIETTIGESPHEIPHSLDYTPRGFLLLGKDGEGDVWAANWSQWSKRSIFLASNVQNLRVRLYVL